MIEIDRRDDLHREQHGLDLVSDEVTTAAAIGDHSTAREHFGDHREPLTAACGNVEVRFYCSSPKSACPHLPFRTASVRLCIMNPANELPSNLLSPPVARDREAGVVRIGDLFGQPNYLLAYLRAAEILVRDGRASGTLDEIAVVCAFQQRHTLELALKMLLGMLHGIADNDSRLTNLNVLVPDSERNHLNTKHDLKLLLSDLQEARDRAVAAGATYRQLPVALGALVDKFTKLECSEFDREVAPSRFRYPNVSISKVRQKKADDKHKREASFPKYLSIPIAELQARLEALVDELFKDIDSPIDSLGQELDAMLQSQHWTFREVERQRQAECAGDTEDR